MRAKARAQPNIALIKYWGKRDTERNLPAVGSISITLDELYTTMDVELLDSDTDDSLRVNGEQAPKMLTRVSQCLDRVLGPDRSPARIVSECNFPIAAGLASSASAFAATVVAAAAAGDRELETPELASLAGAASGSAARSLYGGFAELTNTKDDIAVSSLRAPGEWPLTVIVAVTSAGSKPVSSGDAMEISRRTSPFYSRWVESQDQDLDVAREAIADRDFGRLGSVSEHNCLKMHSVMWASRPSIVYWNSATLNCMQTVRSLQSDGVSVFFTIDAGPQVKAVCLPEHASDVLLALEATEGVTATMRSGLGQGAALVTA